MTNPKNEQLRTPVSPQLLLLYESVIETRKFTSKPQQRGVPVDRPIFKCDFVAVGALRLLLVLLLILTVLWFITQTSAWSPHQA